MRTPQRISVSLLVATALFGFFQRPAVGSGPSRDGKILQQFEMPPFSLTNFGYTQDELDSAAPHGLVVDDRPAIGSGLVWLGDDEYLGITDRGPNIDHFPVNATADCFDGSSNGKTHPLPQFTPAIVKFRAHGGVIEPESILNLVAPGNVGIAGLSNLLPDDDPSFTDPCTAASLLNQDGMDVEDFVLLPNGKFLGVEENRPSLFVGDLATGMIEMRYIPSGKALPAAHYPVSATLPAVLAARSKNRGFEAVAISPDQQTAYTMTQSPLEVGCAGGTGVCRTGRVLRILKLDISDPYAIIVTGQYVFRMSDPTFYPVGNDARELKLSAMSWVGPTKLLLLERTDRVDKGGVRLILVDFAEATDINGTYDASLVPEQTAASGIAHHATSEVVFEEFQTQATPRMFWTYKLEGMAILNASTVAIMNDSDFGIAIPIDAPTNLWKLKLADQLPLGK